MKKDDFVFDDRFEGLKRTAEKEKTERAGRARGEEAPFKKGETVRAPCGDGQGGLHGKFTARVDSCFQYGEHWSVNVVWQAGPEKGKTSMIGPQHLHEVDLVTALGDLVRIAEAAAAGSQLHEVARLHATTAARKSTADPWTSISTT